MGRIALQAIEFEQAILLNLEVIQLYYLVIGYVMIH